MSLNSPAIVDVRGAISHGRLASVCRQLAWETQRLGVSRERGPIVVLIGERVSSLLVMMAMIRVGVVLPLPSSTTVAEMRRVLTCVSAQAVVVDSGAEPPAISACVEAGLAVLEVSTVRDGGLGIPRLSRRISTTRVAQSPAWNVDAAIILSTSGSTGDPKLVPLSWRVLNHAVRSMARTLRLTEGDRCLNVMPLHHTMGMVTLVLCPLWTGGSVIVAPDWDVGAVVETVKTWRPTWYSTGPTFHARLVDVFNDDELRPYLADLRFVRSTSAPLPVALSGEIEKRLAVPVINAYAMTEAPGQITSNQLPPGLAKPGSVGLPDGCDVKVIDGTGAPTEVGESGQIAIRGAHVSAGYVVHNRLHLGRSMPGGWLVTGDVGVFDDDGYLWIVGRTGDLVNRGGEKISPIEVESALHELDSVQNAAVLGIPHATLGEYVGAAVVLKAGCETSAGEIRRLLSTRLSVHKLPDRVVRVPSLPLGPSGKVDKSKLATVFRGR